MKTDQLPYIESIATITQELSSLQWDDPHQLFTQTLTAMSRDATRWLEDTKQTSNGNTPSLERMTVVLTQDLIVLLGHAQNSQIEHDLLHDLRELAEKAVAQHIIQDQSHRDYFMIIDSETEG